MVFQKKTINNVPTLVPLTADTGSGVPVGTVIGQYKKVNMSGYLYLDGSTFDQTLYPALYAYLGTNVLPDYREFVLVGAEQNTTSATIADHDVFTQGQEKDDQLQDFRNNSKWRTFTPNSTAGWDFLVGSVSGTDVTGRFGTTTRTKEKAVFWYIKATTGIIESEATEMLNVINENNSYSTDEIATGKTWIDGKPIYRKVMQVVNNVVTGRPTDVETAIELKPVITYTPAGQSLGIQITGNLTASDGYYFYVYWYNANISLHSSHTTNTGVIVMEYTKTTD